MSKFKMDPKKKKIWLRALRSGKYRQGKDLLKTREGDYCCLGVACAVKLTRPCSSLTKEVGSIYNEGYVRESFLPEAVQEKLQHMNDHKNKSFEQIANWIENNL